ncbi:KTSC domain-containing protein [Nakamurella panacisegetis]|nr:KTSC domain-containing protein [Nakamurella panacisegetis]
MQRHRVVSTTVASVGYDDRTAVLQIEFVQGQVYEYFMVPASVFHGLMKAASPGRFFGEFIRDKFRFRAL